MPWRGCCYPGGGGQAAAVGAHPPMRSEKEKGRREECVRPHRYDRKRKEEQSSQKQVVKQRAVYACVKCCRVKKRKQKKKDKKKPHGLLSVSRLSFLTCAFLPASDVPKQNDDFLADNVVLRFLSLNKDPPKTRESICPPTRRGLYLWVVVDGYNVGVVAIEMERSGQYCWQAHTRQSSRRHNPGTR